MIRLLIKGLLRFDHALVYRLLSQNKVTKLVPALTEWFMHMRATLGAALYRSRLCPTPDSPTRFIASLLQPGSVFIDGGASFGEMSMVASVCVGTAGEVHAFEPHPKAFKRLRNTIALGAFRNVRLNRLLLAERSGKMSFFLNPFSPSSSVSSVFTPTPELVETEAEAVCLDDYWLSCDRVRVDLIKLDVEGFEFPVLRGAEALIRSNHPLLILEITQSERRRVAFGYTIADMLVYLSAAGYHFYVPRQYKLDVVTNGLDLREDDHDLLCIHEHSRLYENATQLLGRGKP